MAITVAITEASYRFVEMPVRRQQVGATLRRVQGITIESRRVLAVGVTVLIALLGFAGVSLATASLRQSDFARTQAEGAQAVTNFETSTTLATAATVAPTTVAPTVAPVIAPGAATTVAVAPTVAATPAPTTVGANEPIPLFAVGDSVMEGAAPSLSAAGFVVDAHQNRQLVDYLPTMQQLAASGRLTGTVVVHLGTNGGFSEADVDRFFDALSGVPNVLVLTDHAQRSWVGANNQLISSLQGRYPNVLVGNWDALAGDCPGNCFYEDGIHLRPDGQAYYTQLIQDWAGLS